MATRYFLFFIPLFYLNSYGMVSTDDLIRVICHDGETQISKEILEQCSSLYAGRPEDEYSEIAEFPIALSKQSFDLWLDCASNSEQIFKKDNIQLAQVLQAADYLASQRIVEKTLVQLVTRIKTEQAWNELKKEALSNGINIDTVEQLLLPRIHTLQNGYYPLDSQHYFKFVDELAEITEKCDLLFCGKRMSHGDIFLAPNHWGELEYCFYESGRITSTKTLALTIHSQWLEGGCKAMDIPSERFINCSYGFLATVSNESVVMWRLMGPFDESSQYVQLENTDYCKVGWHPVKKNRRLLGVAGKDYIATYRYAINDANPEEQFTVTQETCKPCVFKGRVTACSWSADGKQFAVALVDEHKRVSCRFYDYDDGLGEFKEAETLVIPGIKEITAMTATSIVDRNYLVLGDKEGFVSLYDAQYQTIIPVCTCYHKTIFHKKNSLIMSLQMSPDNRLFIRTERGLFRVNLAQQIMQIRDIVGKNHKTSILHNRRFLTQTIIFCLGVAAAGYLIHKISRNILPLVYV